MPHENDIEAYRRMQERCADHARALERTNLATRLLQRRVPNWPREREALEDSRLRWPLLHLFWNHVLQCHYRRTGVDVTPGSVSDWFPYFVSIDVLGHGTPRQLSQVTTQSTRIDLVGRERPEERCSYVLQHVLDAADPLFGLDLAVSDAVGERFLARSSSGGSFRTNWPMYLTVSQITTVLVCMGVVESSVRGVFVDAHAYGAVETPTHPLRRLGVVPEPCFTSEWYGVGSSGGVGGAAFIHRHTGTLVLAERGEVLPFDAWCGGTVDRGVELLLRRL